MTGGTRYDVNGCWHCLSDQEIDGVWASCGLSSNSAIGGIQWAGQALGAWAIDREGGEKRKKVEKRVMAWRTNAAKPADMEDSRLRWQNHPQNLSQRVNGPGIGSSRGKVKWKIVQGVEWTSAIVQGVKWTFSYILYILLTACDELNVYLNKKVRVFMDVYLEVYSARLPVINLGESLSMHGCVYIWKYIWYTSKIACFYCWNKPIWRCHWAKKVVKDATKTEACVMMD